LHGLARKFHGAVPFGMDGSRVALQAAAPVARAGTA
jgi:hypothetical protein